MIWSLLLRWELEAGYVAMDSYPFEDLAQLSPAEDQRPLREAAVVGAQGQTHDSRANVCLCSGPDRWGFVFWVPPAEWHLRVDLS